MRLFVQPLTVFVGITAIGFIAFNSSYRSSAKINYQLDSSSCLPILQSTSNKIHLFTHHCTDEAIEYENDDLDLETDFEIPDEMTRRVHFWVKVFSHYSSNEYLLHSSHYPELVFEIASISESVSTRNYSKYKKEVEKHFATKSKIYKAALLELAADPDNINSHLKKKIVRELAHIDHDDKYKKAAEKLRLQRGQSNAMARGLREFSAYQPHIFKEFRKQNLPIELSYLTFVESTFNRKAVSKVGASGVYQIMPKTGRPYLKINRKFDERRDPIKSAMAAAKILKKNYKITSGEWPLAVTGYNHGAYGMRKAARKHDTTDLWELISEYKGKTFGFASKNFYAEFIAINYIIENKKQLFSNLENKAVIPVHSIKTRRRHRISTLLKKYEVTFESFIKLNPDINKKYRSKRTLLPVGYEFKIDKEKYESWALKNKYWKSKKKENVSRIVDDFKVVSN